MYQNVVNSLIKHPRYPYNHRLLSGVNFVKSDMIASVEFSVSYKPGVNLAVTVLTPIREEERQKYNPKDPYALFPRPQEERNALVYLHTHQGCRIEGMYLVDLLGSYRASLCVFDFAGAGQSGGEFTSFGHFEAEQIQIIVNLLTKQLGFDTIGLWGKSMGGAAAILYGGQFLQPNVKFMVVDSAFDKLKHAIVNIASTQTKAPTFAIKTFLLFVSRTVNNKAGFDIHKVRPIDHIDKINLPIRFIIGNVDQVVKKEEFESLYNKCMSPDKRIVVTPGDHAGNRLEDPYCLGVIKDLLDRFLGPRDGGSKPTSVLKNKHAVEFETINPPNMLAYNREPVIPANFDPKRLANSVHYHKIVAEKKRKDSEDHLPQAQPQQPSQHAHTYQQGQQQLNMVQYGIQPNQPTPQPSSWNYNQVAQPNEVNFDTFGRPKQIQQTGPFQGNVETEKKDSPVSVSKFGFDSLSPTEIGRQTQTMQPNQPLANSPLQLRPSLGNSPVNFIQQQQTDQGSAQYISHTRKPSNQGFNILPTNMNMNVQPNAAGYPQTNNPLRNTIQNNVPNTQPVQQYPNQAFGAANTPNPYEQKGFQQNLTKDTGNNQLVDSMAPYFAQ